MKRKFVLLSILLIGMLGLVRAGGIPQATGHIDRLDSVVLPDHYSFVAQLKNGVPDGQGEILFQPEGERFHIAVDCLTFAGTNTAHIGGIVTDVQVVGTPNPAAVGSHWTFTVIDNGEDSNAPPDQGSAVLGSAPGTCPPLATAPSERGNVQVSP